MGGIPILAHLRATVHGEVSTRDLELVREGGSAVYAMQLEIEQMRREYIARRKDVWGLPSSVQAFYLAFWCAYALQRLGEIYLDMGGNASDLSAGGYTPRVTAEQASAFFQGVEPWMRRATQARIDSSYRFDVRLPAELPFWTRADPCPRAHTEALYVASEMLIGQATIAVNDLGLVISRWHKGDFGRIRGKLAALETSLKYAQAMKGQTRGRRTSRGTHQTVENSLRRIIDGAFLVGQWAAMPRLLNEDIEPQRDMQPEPAGLILLPGQRGFDMWCMTDPTSRWRWQRDHKAVRAIEAFWRNNPNPEVVLGIQTEISAARARGDILPNGQGNYFRCPWSAIYQALTAVTIGGRRIRRGETFTFDAFGDTRGILVANFRRIDDVDYGVTEKGGPRSDH